MRVSIVINSYNYGQFLGEAIRSALGQDWENTEVVVVDDGSTDDSVDIITGFGPAVVPVLKPNGGQASAFNVGVAAATGDAICLLDADDVALPRRASAVSKELARRPDAGWCFHPLVVQEGQQWSPTVVPRPSEGATFVDFRHALLSGREPSFTAPATSGLAFRADFLRLLLPIPERLRITADNYLKVVAMANAPGVVLTAAHGVQRLHGANAYSRSRHDDEGRIAIELEIALQLLSHRELRRYAVNRGMGALKRVPSPISQTLSDARGRFLDACSWRERARIGAHSAWWRVEEIKP